MNSSSLAITMFRTPNVQRYGRSKRKIRSNSSILLLYIKILPIWIETSHHPRHHTTRKDTTTTTTTHSSLTCINNNNEPLPGPQRVETNRDNR